MKRWETGQEAVQDARDRDGRHVQVFSGGDIPLTSGGFRIILKNARITAEKVIIQPIKPGTQPGGEHHGTQKP